MLGGNKERAVALSIALKIKHTSIVGAHHAADPRRQRPNGAGVHQCRKAAQARGEVDVGARCHPTRDQEQLCVHLRQDQVHQAGRGEFTRECSRLRGD